MAEVEGRARSRGGEVLANAQRAANGLLELGVRPGERVAILMGNRPEFLWAHLGILFIGALSVPVNISQRGATLQHILADSDAVAVSSRTTCGTRCWRCATAAGAAPHGRRRRAGGRRGSTGTSTGSWRGPTAIPTSTSPSRLVAWG